MRYYDGFTNDARLTLDTLRSAAKSGASVLNYCRFKDAARSEVWECELEDRLAQSDFPGARPGRGERDRAVGRRPAAQPGETAPHQRHSPRRGARPGAGDARRW